MSNVSSRRANQLLWVIPVLLLAALLGSLGLDMDAYSYDEMRSIIVAGGAHYGPLSYPDEILARVTDESPDQAVGLALVLWPWGTLVGWTEFATRVMPLLVGMLALATTYRAGNDLFNPIVGRVAVLVLTTSIFYVTYLHKLRIFTFASLSVTGALWCYWRIMLDQRRAGLFAYVGLFLSGVGLLHTHYFTTPFLLVIGLYHLIFGRKHRTWWVVTGVAVLAGLTLLPLLPIIYDGYLLNQTRGSAQAAAMGPFETIYTMMRFFGNGSWLAFVGIMALTGWAAWRPPAPNLRRNTVYLLWATGGMLVAILGMGAAAGVLAPWRVRYLMPLWTLLALLTGLGVWKVWGHARYAAVALLAVWSAAGLVVIQQDTLMYFNRGDQMRMQDWRGFAEPLFEPGTENDTFMYLGGRFGYWHGHYTHGYPKRNFVPPYEGEREMVAALDGELRVWAGVHGTQTEPDHLETFHRVMGEQSYLPCGAIFQGDVLSMELYVKHTIFCPSPDNPPITTWVGAHLEGVAVEQTDGQTQVNTSWSFEPDFPYENYSVSIKAYDADGAFIDQYDTGLTAAIQAAWDELPEDAQFRAVVYDWRTGERLMAAGAASSGEFILE